MAITNARTYDVLVVDATYRPLKKVCVTSRNLNTFSTIPPPYVKLGLRPMTTVSPPYIHLGLRPITTVPLPMYT